MKTFQDISAGFHAAYNEQEARCNAIKAEAERMKGAAMRYYSLAARKMGECYKLYRKMREEHDIGWTDMVVSLLNEIEERTGWVFAEKNDLRTFGLRAECPVTIRGEGKDEYGYRKVKARIVFTPAFRHIDDDMEFELYYDTGELREERAPSGSIAALNGFDNISAKVESVEQIIEFLQKQIDGYEETTGKETD